MLSRSLRTPARRAATAAAISLALVLAGCAREGGPSPVSSVGAIDHPTGATDVVLRLDEGGGFVPIDFFAGHAPTFSLFGNGVVVFQPKVRTLPGPDATNVVHGVPWRTATLNESQVQDLLAFSLGPSGLAAARTDYADGRIGDASTSTFTIHAGGIDKTVAVYALAESANQGPDAVARDAFGRLATGLRDFDQGGVVASDVYVPARYRGVLTERDPVPGLLPMKWPWPALGPADFQPGVNDGTGPRLPHRTFSPNEVAALGIVDYLGGLQGMTVAGPNGKTYLLVIRPLLVDEKA